MLIKIRIFLFIASFSYLFNPKEIRAFENVLGTISSITDTDFYGTAVLFKVEENINSKENLNFYFLTAGHIVGKEKSDAVNLRIKFIVDKKKDWLEEKRYPFEVVKQSVFYDLAIIKLSLSTDSSLANLVDADYENKIKRSIMAHDFDQDQLGHAKIMGAEDSINYYQDNSIQKLVYITPIEVYFNALKDNNINGFKQNTVSLDPTSISTRLKVVRTCPMPFYTSCYEVNFYTHGFSGGVLLWKNPNEDYKIAGLVTHYLPFSYLTNVIPIQKALSVAHTWLSSLESSVVSEDGAFMEVRDTKKYNLGANYNCIKILLGNEASQIVCEDEFSNYGQIGSNINFGSGGGGGQGGSGGGGAGDSNGGGGHSDLSREGKENQAQRVSVKKRNGSNNTIDWIGEFSISKSEYRKQLRQKNLLGTPESRDFFKDLFSTVPFLKGHQRFFYYRPKLNFYDEKSLSLIKSKDALNLSQFISEYRSNWGLQNLNIEKEKLKGLMTSTNSFSFKKDKNKLIARVSGKMEYAIESATINKQFKNEVSFNINQYEQTRLVAWKAPITFGWPPPLFKRTFKTVQTPAITNLRFSLSGEIKFSENKDGGPRQSGEYNGQATLYITDAEKKITKFKKVTTFLRIHFDPEKQYYHLRIIFIHPNKINNSYDDISTIWMPLELPADFW